MTGTRTPSEAGIAPVTRQAGPPTSSVQCVSAPRVEILYLDGCPNWEITAIRLAVALQVTGYERVPVEVRCLHTWEEAQRSGFTGSPMVRIDGADPFAYPGQQASFACRMFLDGDEVGHSPTVPQLIRAIHGACGTPSDRRSHRSER